MKNVFRDIIIILIIVTGFCGCVNNTKGSNEKPNQISTSANTGNSQNSNEQPNVPEVVNSVSEETSHLFLKERNFNEKELLIAVFPDDKYTKLSEPLETNNRKIWFAVKYINEQLEIVDTAIGYEVIDGIAYIYLLIKDFKFINEDNSVLLDFSKGYSGVYGFNITYSYPKTKNFPIGLNIRTYFDLGKREADTFKLNWNETKKQFELFDPFK